MAWQFLNDITGQAIGPIFKDHKIPDFLTLVDGTDRLSLYFGKELSTLHGVISKKNNKHLNNLGLCIAF